MAGAKFRHDIARPMNPSCRRYRATRCCRIFAVCFKAHPIADVAGKAKNDVAKVKGAIYLINCCFKDSGALHAPL
ncbi:MAG: hypothetical protein GPOALKHO_000141 [Sodalis sp.]|nr:MAG: hypothetical protein GPOALKHO_000141 [Sodalis sp.]